MDTIFDTIGKIIAEQNKINIKQAEIITSLLRRLEKSEFRIQKIVEAFPYNFNQESFWRD